MKTAYEIKERSKTMADRKTRVLVYTMHDQMCQAIERSLEKGLDNASILVPQDLDTLVVNAFGRVLKKMGYKVTLAYADGYARSADEPGSGLVLTPSYRITVRW